VPYETKNCNPGSNLCTRVIADDADSNPLAAIHESAICHDSYSDHGIIQLPISVGHRTSVSRRRSAGTISFLVYKVGYRVLQESLDALAVLSCVDVEELSECGALA
jgi:hypothetical protein